jgi:hypothetical protein
MRLFYQASAKSGKLLFYGGGIWQEPAFFPVAMETSGGQGTALVPEQSNLMEVRDTKWQQLSDRNVYS